MIHYYARAKDKNTWVWCGYNGSHDTWASYWEKEWDDPRPTPRAASFVHQHRNASFKIVDIISIEGEGWNRETRPDVIKSLTGLRYTYLQMEIATHQSLRTNRDKVLELIKELS